MFGLNPLFARIAYAAGLNSVTALIYRFFVPAIIMLVFVVRQPLDPITSLRALAIGFGMGLGMIGYFKALETLPVGMVALIYFTYPVFTLGIGLIFFRIAISRTGLLASAMILIACVLILEPSELPEDGFVAVMVAFIAPIGFAVLIHGISHWLLKLSPASRTGLLIWGHALALAPFILAGTEGAVIPSNFRGWIGVIGLATVSSLIPQFLVVVGAPLAGPERTAVAGTFELITSLVIGWIVLQEPVTMRSIIAGMLVLGALYIYRPVNGNPIPDRTA
jgi:drug/metabolite transporter (DMT)-like permease